MRAKRSLAACFGVALVLSACGASEGGDSATTAPTEQDIAAESTLPLEAEPLEAEPLEPVMVPTAAGAQLDFNALRGQDVLLWFWAPW